MDFVAEQLVNGTRFRALPIVDVFTREALDIVVAQRLRAEHVVEACNRLVASRGAPVRVFVDNGSEFSVRVFDLWANHCGVTIDFSRPGKPTDNCFIETFNRSFRDECLNVHWSRRLTRLMRRSKLGARSTTRVDLTRLSVN
jgi:putative transposase